MSFTNILKEILEEQRAKLVKTDTDSSMGPWINVTKQNILRIIDNLKSNFMILSLKIGVVCYRDYPPQDSSYITQVHRLSEIKNKDNCEKLVNFINKMAPSGGGDCPECLSTAMFDSVRINWTPKSARTAIIFTDAPAHGVGSGGDGFPKGDPNESHWLEQCYSLKEQNVTVHAICCGGMQLTKDMLEKMCKVCGGSSIQIEQRYIQEIVIGAGEDCIDKNRVRHLIERKIEENAKVLSKLDNEYERVEKLMELFKKESIFRRKLAGFFVRQLKFKKLDLKEGIMTIRREKRSICDVFPTFGLSDKRYEIGLFNVVDGDKPIECFPLVSSQVECENFGAVSVVDLKYVFKIVEKKAVFKFPYCTDIIVKVISKSFVANDTLGDQDVVFNETRVGVNLTVLLDLHEVFPSQMVCTFDDLPEKENLNVSLKLLMVSQSNENHIIKIPSELFMFQRCNVDISVDVKIPFNSLSSKTHKVIVQDSKIGLHVEKGYFDKDILIAVDPKNPVNILRGKDKIAIVDYMPEFESKKVEEVSNKELLIVFQSTARVSHKFEEYKIILKHILERISKMNIKFNVLKYSSKFESLFKKMSTSKKKENIKKFQTWIDHNILFGGGSEFYQPLKKRRNVENILFIGSGWMTDTIRVYKSLGKCRFFSLGIDRSCVNDSFLLQKFAKKTKGYHFLYEGKKSVNDMFERIFQRLDVSDKNLIDKSIVSGKRMKILMKGKNVKFYGINNAGKGLNFLPKDKKEYKVSENLIDVFSHLE